MIKLLSVVFVSFTVGCVYGEIDWRHYTTKAISKDVGTLFLITSLCHEDLCCEFHVNASVSENVVNDMQYYRYRLAVYNGNITFPGFPNNAIVACTLLACASDDTSNCNTHMDEFENIFTFTGLVITGNFPIKGKKYFRKHTDTNFKELQVVERNHMYLDEEKGMYEKIYSESKGELNDLMTYGIFGVNFSCRMSYSSAMITIGVILVFIGKLL